VLIVLVLVYVLNFIDRQILSILAEDIKADLGLSDADLGFLYGTVFAVFYAVFGIPLGRVSDIWVRKNMISIGLFVWSAMTALSGTAKGFASLAGYRIGVGVGVGESSASPAALFETATDTIGSGLERDGFPEDAVAVLKRAGYDAWVNSVGHIAVDPKGLSV